MPWPAPELQMLCGKEVQATQEFLHTKKTIEYWMFICIPSRELTYPPKNGIFEDDFASPQVGYVNFLEGMFIYVYFHVLSHDFWPAHDIVTKTRGHISRQIALFQALENAMMAELLPCNKVLVRLQEVPLIRNGCVLLRSCSFRNL